MREVPDLRAIRYYTTLGLLDRPAAMRGRTALYGRRHLLQIVAIKRLQAEGLPLVAIQERLAGVSDAALRRIARIPADLAEPDAGPPPTEERSPRTRFWAETPAPVLQGIPLRQGLTLLVDLERMPDSDDLAALRAASSPLVDLLAARGLIRPRHERNES